ncbi:MAG TPA: TlpA disulfide reductase family protein [Gaiellaceae bacterium]|jgi:cytochrome c biogenesis protein CcmG/thiol:disulfide interchange protein DsbE
MRLARVAAAAGVVALACVLVWRLAHQDNSTAKAVLHNKVVPAPAFRLARLGGGPPLTLASLRGKAVVINFWASDCGPCKQEMPRLQSAAARWAGKGATVVGIDTLDSRGAAKDFARKHGVTYAIGYDDVGEIATRYGVAWTPTTFFVDRRGRIVKRVLGPVPRSELDTEIKHALRA